MINDYMLIITPSDASFRPSAESVSHLIEFLDLKFYLEGPDRDLSYLVTLPQRETKVWAEFVQQNQQALVTAGPGPATSAAPTRKRYVHILHSPTAIDEPYKNYSQLCNLIENLQPRDTPYVAALGRGARSAWKALYLPMPKEERNRWMMMQTFTIVSGYHPIWRRVWDAESMHKEWELVTAKAFKIMIGCKLSRSAEKMEIGELVTGLQVSPDYQILAKKIGEIIGTPDLELLGFDLR